MVVYYFNYVHPYCLRPIRLLIHLVVVYQHQINQVDIIKIVLL